MKRGENRVMAMMWSRLAISFAAAAAAMVFTAGSASAQIGNSDEPVVVDARSAEYLQKEGRGVYIGNVVATQGDANIKTDKLTVICARDPGAGEQAANSCDIERLIAEGNVYYSAPDARIRGDRAEYDFPTDTITITGDVILSRGDDGVVRGTTVKYSIGDGRTVITAGQSRVTTVFNTAKKPETPAQPATPAPAPGTTPAPQN